MPRKPRFFVAGAPVHVLQRGHGKAAVFFDEFDYLEYLRCLKQAADSCGCAIHAYALMTNHVHLLLTPDRADSVARLFQAIGRHYVRHINQTYQRSGGLWEGRHKCNVIDSAQHLLACMRYIELNPVRAKMVSQPADYRWTSYVANAYGVSNAIVLPHTEYVALGGSIVERNASYRALFSNEMDADELKALRAALQTGTPLGNDRFKAEIEAALNIKVGHARRGRPKLSSST